MEQFLYYDAGTSAIWIKMPSTVIAAIYYNAETQVLKINFVSGLVYAYKNVPEEVYKQLHTSGQKGIYFNQHIKGKYLFEKVI